MLRVMRDVGLGVPKSYGFIEITPEREYVIVTDFVDGAQELLEAEIDDGIVDDALSVVRRLWDAGIAHRDIKPSNLLVRDGKVYLIDVAFAEVRPSPWRQAVDLANMMLILGIRSSPEEVYSRAQKFFTPEELAEAFAATHSVTMPSQSRNLLRKHHRDVLARFRELAPPRSPISIQRWSVRRVGLTLGVLLAGLLAVSLVVGNLQGAGLVVAGAAPGVRQPDCHEVSGPLILEAQSVPSASLLPCLESLPTGWSFQALDVRNGLSRFYLNSDRVGMQAVGVTLSSSCDTSRASEIPSDEPGTRRFEHVSDFGRHYSGSRYYVFPGGCVTYVFNFTGEGDAPLANEVSLGLGLYPQEDLSAALRRTTGLRL
jgi:serine/threonine protein kinase